MYLTEKTIIGDIVSHDYQTSTIFSKYEIDFCCNGNRSIENACSNAKITSTELLHDLEEILINKESKTANYNSSSLDFLSNYIYENHHKYVEQKIPEIKQYLNKICDVHGEFHSELFTIKDLFKEGASELTTHMKKEELILFPFIKKMLQAEKEGNKLPTSSFDTVKNPISMMQEEHDTEGERYREISKLSNNYNAPLDACNSYKIAFAMLKEFEKDLHKHIHLESNILFPKALELERKINN